MQTMDEVTNVQKQRLKLQTHLQSLSVQFKQNTVQTPSSFPPIYIRMTRGSRVVESSNVPLTASTTTPGKYSAQWEGSILSMVLTVSRDVKSGRFESRDVRYQLKIYSEGKASHKTLASCRFDVTNLNLQSADCSPSAEKQQLQFNVGKNATAAISDIVLEATFQYELLPDQPTFSLEESTSITSPCSPSPSCSSPSLLSSPLSALPPTPFQHSPSSTLPQPSSPVPQYPPTAQQFKQSLLSSQESHHYDNEAKSPQDEIPPSELSVQLMTTDKPTIGKENNTSSEVTLEGGIRETVDGGPEMNDPLTSSPNVTAERKTPKRPKSAEKSKVKRFKAIFKIKGKSKNQRSQKETLLDPMDLKTVETTATIPTTATTVTSDSSQNSLVTTQRASGPPCSAEQLFAKSSQSGDVGDSIPQLQPSRDSDGRAHPRPVDNQQNMDSPSQKVFAEGNAGALESKVSLGSKAQEKISIPNEMNFGMQLQSTPAEEAQTQASFPFTRPQRRTGITNIASSERHKSPAQSFSTESSTPAAGDDASATSTQETEGQPQLSGHTPPLKSRGISQTQQAAQAETRRSVPVPDSSQLQNSTKSEATHITHDNKATKQMPANNSVGSNLTKLHQLQNKACQRTSADSITYPRFTSADSTSKHVLTQIPLAAKVSETSQKQQKVWPENRPQVEAKSRRYSAPSVTKEDFRTRTEVEVTHTSPLKNDSKVTKHVSAGKSAGSVGINTKVHQLQNSACPCTGADSMAHPPFTSTESTSKHVLTQMQLVPETSQKQQESQLEHWPQVEANFRRYSVPSVPKEERSQIQTRQKSQVTHTSPPLKITKHISASKSAGSVEINTEVHQLQKRAHPHTSADSTRPPSALVETTPRHVRTQMKPLSKVLSGSTPTLASLQGDKSSSTSDLSHRSQGTKARRISMGDLLQPVQSSAIESVIKNRRQSLPATHNLLGILKMKLSAVNIANDTQGPSRRLVDIIFDPESSRDLSKSTHIPTDGLFCVFTINAGNSRAETSVQPIVPRRPVVWDESEEVLFYANQSRQVFILCHKTTLNSEQVGQKVTSFASSTKGERRKSQIKDETCIGAAVFSISRVKVSSSGTDLVAADLLQCLQRQTYEAIQLPLQPKGMLLLKTCFFALQPRLKVSCEGTVIVQSLSGVNSNPDHNLSCTIKVDSEFQNSTSMMGSNDCASEGWGDEPVEFSAHQNLDCEIQIWAYSSEGTEYWCGGCTLPLAMVLPDEEVQNHRPAFRGEDGGEFVVSRPCEKTITMPIEPKGLVTLSILLSPGSKSRPQSPDLVAADVSSGQETPADRTSGTNPKQQSLRRNFSTTLRKTGDFSLKIRKTYTEEPFILQQQNTDLVREVEYLREELGQAKAKLAESEFFREKALLELRATQEELERVKGDQDTNSSKRGPKKTSKYHVISRRT